MSQWIPTHVQFTVLRARNLIAKGKGGNNDVFVTIQLGKEKYQTSTIKNALNPEWFEECDLPVTNMGLEIEVSVYHRGVLSDDFLGYAAIPLWEYKITETAASRWVSLRNKPSKPGPDKYRGELEVKLTFHSQHRHDSMSQAIKKRSPSIRNLTTTIGDKIKLARSRSFRENRRESDFGKMDKCQSFVATEPSAFNESQAEVAINSNTNVDFLGNFTFSSLPLLSEGEVNVYVEETSDALTRSYSMSTAYIKTMSLDRNKRLNYSVRSNLTNKHSSQNVAAETASPGMAECYSQSLYSLPLKRRGFDVPFNQLPPPPYNLKVSPKDDSSTTLTENTPNTPNSHSSSTLSNSLSPGPSQLEPTRLEFSGIYESIKEKTEPENTASSSSDPESVPMPKIRGKRFAKKQPFPVRSRNQDSLKDGAAPSHAIGRENSDQQQFYGNGRDSGILDDRSSSLGNSLEGSLAAIDVTNTGSKLRGPSGSVDAHIDHGKSDTPLGRTPADRGLLYHLDREMSMSGSIRQRKTVSPPSMFYSKENKQGELVVRKRSRSQRDRDRNRLLQIKQAGSPGLYDDSVSEASDVSPVPDDLLSVFKNMTKEELLRVVITSKAQMIRKDQYIRDLENYIDDLLVRVMESTPRLLTRPQPIHRF